MKANKIINRILGNIPIRMDCKSKNKKYCKECGKHIKSNKGFLCDNCSESYGKKDFLVVNENV